MPKRGGLVAALALAAFLALPAAIHAAENSCGLKIDKRFKSEFRAFCNQWRAGKPKLPKALKHDTVLFVHPDGRYVYSYLSSAGYGMAVIEAVSYTDEGNQTIFSLVFEDEGTENFDTGRIFPETAFRYFLLSKKFRPISGKNTRALSRVRFPVRGFQLNLTFRYKGRSHSFKLQNWHSDDPEVKNPVCKPGKVIRVAGGKNRVLIQFDRPVIVFDAENMGSRWCEREQRLVEVMLDKGAPTIRYRDPRR
ncbi:MAG: hypothetical protein V3S64_10980 [bacterium]